MSGLLFACMEGRISSWWIRFSYNQFKQNKLTVYPCQSKVIMMDLLLKLRIVVFIIDIVWI